MSEIADDPRNDMSLLAMFRFLIRHVVVIAISVVIFAAGGVVLALNLQPMYRADVVVSPVDSSSGASSLAGQLGGLASIAGINMGGGGSKKSDEALEYLRSRTFTANFLQHHGLMPLLFARKWDAVRNQWRAGVDVPTIAEGVAKFTTKVRQVTEDRRTGIVTVSIIWSDRVAASNWANWLIAEADGALRERAIAEQGRSIEYLKSEAARTSTVETGNAISKLMETEFNNAMLARTRDAYAFKVIDPATVRDPKDRDSPNKPLIVVLCTGIGFAVGIIIAAVRHVRLRHP